MREIKFRAWMKDSKLMIEDVVPIHNEVYGHYCKDLERDTDKYLKLKNCEIMQYTGLKDRNGKEIYEGDIVEAIRYDGLAVTGVVGFRDCSFVISTGYQTIYTWMDYQIEIIGNIHENPELLGVQE